MKDYSDFYAARKTIADIVRQDLLGPVYEDEVINEPPTSYYIMGKLYPKTDIDLDNDDKTTSVDIEASEGDKSIAATNARDPRAMGITFTVKQGAEDLRILVCYCRFPCF